MFEWSISFGNMITLVALMGGLIGSGLVNSLAVGRYFGAMDKRVDSLDKRMDSLEVSTTKITELLIALGQQKVLMEDLTRRLNDVQTHGSYRLAEVLEENRTKIMAEVKDRLENIERRLSSVDRKLGPGAG